MWPQPLFGSGLDVNDWTELRIAPPRPCHCEERSDDAIQRASGHPPAALDCFAALAMTTSIILALRFFWRPELCQRCSRTGLQTNIRGGGAPKDAGVDTAFPAGRRNWPVRSVRRGARRFWRTRSPSGALPRLSPSFYPRLSPVPRFTVAATCATRAASSWQTGVVAGRASFRTARGRSYEPHPGHRSRSINRPSPVDVPWTSEMKSFSSLGGADSRNSARRRHPHESDADFFSCLFDSHRANCGTLP